MNSQTLHILNGDATLPGFIDCGIEGDTLIWRETLSEGPVANTLDAGFWKMRAQWISNTYNASEQEYFNWEATELAKINEPYDEINLWFEFDLFCQVNLLGVMQMLNQQTDLSERAVHLICPDTVPGVDNFRGLGQLSGGQLETLFDDRIQLTDYDFKLAAEAWQLYIAGDAENLKTWLITNSFWGSLHALKPAMEAHVKRLEVNAAGYNYIEQTLLEIYNSGITSRPAIYEAFWKDNSIYGMGDKQIDIYLDKLGL
ncbi:DUF1835 domain-containing protein [Mucilaginibacter ginkgonis]|uniref:DUF1835 domain-containing protein n=1 Tax=Mucilaginibacter ginkgonis TaxID=2682091 RepID=A0A6I4INE0_9SPHI|nr:DUF1835 domain-containing protein [Mucilaginibacter ginkgonis]QQL49335.1 DUF1835 domain-containing protein [Mucilaginibacter ginkgonis]